MIPLNVFQINVLADKGNDRSLSLPERLFCDSQDFGINAVCPRLLCIKPPLCIPGTLTELTSTESMRKNFRETKQHRENANASPFCSAGQWNAVGLLLAARLAMACLTSGAFTADINLQLGSESSLPLWGTGDHQVGGAALQMPKP